MMRLVLLAFADSNYSEWARQSCTTLQHRWFNHSSGTWNGRSGQDPTGAHTQIGWWNAANALEATVNCAMLMPTGGKGRAQMEQIIDTFFLKERIGDIQQSRSYDDSGWVALAWARAFEFRPRSAFLARAEVFWQQVQREGWDQKCGGGLYWAGDEAGGGNRYKNAISNELFLMSSAKLYQLTHNSTYKKWALREWEWFNQSGMIQHGIVKGGLTSSCQNDGSEGFTYNQGVILGGLAALFSITGDASLLRAAEGLIDTVLASAVYTYPDHILREPCEPYSVPDLRTCNADQEQFKGIFVRYLRYFLAAATVARPSSEEKHEGSRAEKYEGYRLFLMKNADAVWQRDRDTRTGTFGLSWEGPLPQKATPGAILQTSAVDALTSAAWAAADIEAV